MTMNMIFLRDFKAKHWVAWPKAQAKVRRGHLARSKAAGGVEH